MKSLSRKTFGALGILLLFASAAEAYPGMEHRRGPWYIGFGIGGGDAGYTLNGQSVGYSDMMRGLDSVRVAGNFQVGGTVLEQLLVGFDMLFIREQGSVGTGGITVNAATQITDYNVMATYFPLVTGFFVRGGTGLALAIQDVSVGVISQSESVSGFDVDVGVGYAFWLLKSFNLTVGIDLAQQFYSKQTGKPDDSRFWTFNLGFMWY